ncbi:MAG: CHAT domain-containing protein [Acidobacteriota bacterium]
MSQDPSQSFRAAIDLLHSGKVAAARKSLLRFTRGHPDDPWAQQELARSFVRGGRAEEGRAHFVDRLEHAPSAAVHHGLGYLARLLRQPAEATASFESALALDESMHASALELASLRLLAGDAHARRALEQRLAACRIDGDRWGEAAALNYLARAELMEGRLREALAKYEAARQLKSALGERFGEAAALCNAGLLQLDLGEMRAALISFRSALKLAKAGRDDLLHHAALANLGVINEQLGNLNLACKHWSRALRKAEQLGNTAEVQRALLVLANLHHRAGRSHVAQKHAARVEARTGASLPTGQSALLQGQVAVRSGDHEAARRHLRKAVRVATRLANSGLLADAENHLAGTELAAGRLDRALQHAWAGLAASERLAESGLRAVGFERDARLHLAAIHEERGELREAWEQHRVVLELSERGLKDLRRQDLQFSWLAETRQSTERVIDLALSAAGACSVDEPVERSFLDAERARGVVLRELLQRGGWAEASQLTGPLVEDRHRLHIELAALTGSDGETSAERRRRRARRRRVEAALEELDRRAEEQLEAAAASATWSLSDLRRRLSPETALLAYFVGRESVHAWCVTRDGVEARRLPVSPRQLRRDLSRLLRPLRGVQAAADLRVAMGALELELASVLHGCLVAPFSERLEGRGKLIVVPDGPLHHLPFELLPVELGGDPDRPTWQQARYLVERHRVSHAASASVVLERRRRLRTAGGEGVLALGGPPDLPGAQRELAAIARDRSTLLVTGDEATPSRYRELAGRCRVVHLASHARVDDARPWSSALALSSSDGGEGRLSARDIAECPLRAELVIVSGCQTGHGPLREGEGLLSLARAFHLAGAPTLVVSAWSVQDETTTELMVDFHRELRRGRLPVDALSNAKRAMIERGRRHGDHRCHPFSWAPFLLTEATSAR